MCIPSFYYKTIVIFSKCFYFWNERGLFNKYGLTIYSVYGSDKLFKYVQPIYYVQIESTIIVIGGSYCCRRLGKSRQHKADVELLARKES